MEKKELSIFKIIKKYKENRVDLFSFSSVLIIFEGVIMIIF
jgi:hypothetical protein